MVITTSSSDGVKDTVRKEATSVAAAEGSALATAEGVERRLRMSPRSYRRGTMSEAL